MPANASFDVAAAPDRVMAYLENPRNLLIGNREGPIVEQSVAPVGPGSWSVLAFDQIRARVEYTAFERPRLVAASVVYSGRGSGGMSGTVVYRLVPGPGAGVTRVMVEAEGQGGWLAGLVNRLTWPLVWRRLRDRMSREAA